MSTEMVILRKATKKDARKIAELIDLAASGLEVLEWQKQIRAGQSPLDVGMAEVLEEGNFYNYRNATLAEQSGKVIGLALCFVLAHRSPEEIATLSIASQTYARLKNHAVGYFYIDSLACFPDHQGKGVGSLMIEDAIARARKTGHKNICLMAYEANQGAVRLYQKRGFKIIQRLPVPTVPHMPYQGDVVLLSQSLV